MKASRSAKLGGGGRPAWPPSLLLLLLIGRYEGFARLTPSVAEGAATALRFCAPLFASAGDPTGTLHGFEWAKPAAKLCSPLAFDTRRASSPSMSHSEGGSSPGAVSHREVQVHERPRRVHARKFNLRLRSHPHS